MRKFCASAVVLAVLGCGGDKLKVRENEGLKSNDLILGVWTEGMDGKVVGKVALTTDRSWHIEAEQITAISKCSAQGNIIEVKVTAPIQITPSQIETLNNAYKKESITIDGEAHDCEAKIRKSQLDYKILGPGLIELESPNSQESIRMNKQN